MMRYTLVCCICLLTLSGLSQGENQIKLRYWNGTTNGVGVRHDVGLKISAEVRGASRLIKMEQATLSDAAAEVNYKRTFMLFFTVENVSDHDVAIYDWAFKAVCPVDNLGRSFNATSMVALVTPYIPTSIYIILKPGERKQFYSAETDFYWCLPQKKDDLLLPPGYFQALLTCAAITGSPTAAKPGQKPGVFQPPATVPPKPGNEIDPQLESLIKEHNTLVQKNEIEKAEALKLRILKITGIAYPEQVKLIESKLIKPQPVSSVATSSAPTEEATLSFNGRAIEAEGECLGTMATLTSSDETAVLVLNNLGNNGSFSVNANFYTNACTDCLAVQFQDIKNAKTYIAVSGSVRRTAQKITIDVTVKELMSLLESGGSTYKVTGKIMCE